MSSNVRKWVCGVAGEKNSRARCSKVRISRISSFKVGNRGMWSSRGEEQLDEEAQQGKEYQIEEQQDEKQRVVEQLGMGSRRGVWSSRGEEQQGEEQQGKE